MANKTVLTVASSVGAILLAAGIATEGAGRYCGNTWNGPLWLAARARYFAYVKQHHDCKNQAISDFIAESGKGTLTVTVNNGRAEATYTKEQEETKTPVQQAAAAEPKAKEEEEKEDETKAPVPEPEAKEEEPVSVEQDGIETYYGWKGVWVWLNHQQ